MTPGTEPPGRERPGAANSAGPIQKSANTTTDKPSITPDGDGPAGYADIQPLLAANGYTALPLAANTKSPVPVGFTGRDRRKPDETERAMWRQLHITSNAAIVMPDDVVVDGVVHWVVGLDVDAYGAKTGARTLAVAQERFGPLPPTDRITSRDDNVSGIRLFLVPAGTGLAGNIKFPDLGFGDIDILQCFHRYAVTSPSIHPEGRRYRVIDEATGEVLQVPRPAVKLPLLPERWVGRLLKGTPRNNSTTAGERKDSPRGRAGGVINVTEAMTGGEPSQKVALRLARALHELAGGLSRHDTVLGHVLALLWFGRNGESGVELALVTLYRAFVDAVADDRPGGEPEAADEFQRMCSNAEAPLAAEPPRERWPGPRASFGARAGRETPQDGEFWTEFWDRRDYLRHIHQYARARRVSPWAKLGSTAARALAAIPPDVVLPPLVGGRASLNALVALVGASGAGKDAAEAASRDGVLLGDCGIPVVPIGSGEGLSRTFRPQGTKPADPNPVTRAIFSALEIDTWAALAERSGSTLTAEIRKLYTGSILGFGNAGRDTRNIVAAHSYRACVLLGVQPLRSGPLLDAADGGLPQRLVWLPALDPGAPDRPPTVPEPLTISLPNWDRRGPLTSVGLIPDWDQSGDHIVLWVPDAARDEMDSFRTKVLRGEPGVDPLDRHTLLTRLKVAAALMALDTRTAISEEDWDLAGVVMTVSAATRGECREALSEQSRRNNHARALSAFERDEVVSDSKLARCKQGILRWLPKLGEKHISRRDLTRKLKFDLRVYFDTAVAELIEEGGIVEVPLERGTAYVGTS